MPSPPGFSPKTDCGRDWNSLPMPEEPQTILKPRSSMMTGLASAVSGGNRIPAFRSGRGALASKY